MNQDDCIIFLGTAGARFAVARQIRSSGGIFVRLKGKNILLDPGPGTLVRLAQVEQRIEVNLLDAIILSHAHIDHSCDANVLIDGMTSGGLKQRGLLFAPMDCLHGENMVILNYLRKFLQDITILQEKSKYQIGNVTFTTSCRHIHGVETYGFKFIYGESRISFVMDTKLTEELIDSYKNTDLLIMNTVLLKSHERINHLSIDDAAVLLKKIKPKRAVLTHFGMPVLEACPDDLAVALTLECGLPVQAASDGLKLDLFQLA